MALAVLEYRFTSPPTEQMLVAELCRELGSRAPKRFEEIGIVDDRARFLAGDLVVLLYAGKVCQRLGGRAMQYGTTEECGQLALPPWAARAWVDHSWPRRLAIRCGTVRLAFELAV